MAIESVKGPQLRKLYLAYVLAALVPVGLLVLVQIPLLWQWNTIHRAQQQRNQIKEEILRVQRLTSDIENGFRGYVLTSQSAFLHPVVSGEARVQDSVEHLMRLTQEFPNLQARVKVLSTRLRELIDSKRKMTLQVDSGKQEEVLAYIRGGEGLALSKTIEKAVEDFEARIDTEFSPSDLDVTSFKERTLQRLLWADVAILLLGILVTRIVFRSAMNGIGLQFPPASVVRNQ
ncbi:MAG: CHASE3 domain-containing protein [Nitrospiraceae bacterium]